MFPVRTIFWAAIAITLAIILNHIILFQVNASMEGGLPEFVYWRFNINGEANIPTWYSTALLLLVAQAAFGVHLLRRQAGQALAPGLVHVLGRYFWLGFGLVYVFFSLDEAALVHELFDKLGAPKWVFFYAPGAFLYVSGCLLYFFRVEKDQRSVRNWVLGGLLVYVIGGVGLEWVGYHYQLHLHEPLLQIEIVFEELFEFTGTAMVLAGCLTALNEALAHWLPAQP